MLLHPISNYQVPAIAASLAKKDIEKAKSRLTFSMFLTIVIIAPCAVGLITLAEPILKTIYPNSSEGEGLLAITSISMTFVALSYVITGGLYGLGKTHIPAIALAIGATVKIVLNIVLVSNPQINVYGSPISSTVCQMINFIICTYFLTRHIKLDLNYEKHILKPVISALIMGVVAYFSHRYLLEIIGNSKATIIAILMGAITYGIMIIATKTLNKEDFSRIPLGTKIYDMLVRFKIYKNKV